MNIHEHQAKELLLEFGAPVSKGIVIYNLKDIDEKIKTLKSKKFVLKAQIHAGGRGKAGGVKLVKDINELKKEANNLFGKKLVTPQTGPAGKQVQRLYIEEASEIDQEFYLSCLVDRQSSKIAFISSKEGGMDIEEVASKSPEKIITTKIDLTENLKKNDIEKILKPFNLNTSQKREGFNLINSIYKTLTSKDASLIEINPLILTKSGNLICLDAKINFDDNALLEGQKL